MLDCGCGTGANLELLDRFGRAYGFDLTEIGLRIGRDAGRTRLARATVTAVPFPTASFDIVTSFDVLYSLPDSEDENAAIAEMYRLLKPGGYALVNVAAMHMLRGDHSVLSREVRRYSRGELRGQDGAGRVRDPAPDLHQRHARSRRWRSRGCCSGAAACVARARPTRRSRCRRRRSTRS